MHWDARRRGIGNEGGTAGGKMRHVLIICISKSMSRAILLLLIGPKVA
jgi:hypothetical protein